MKTPMKNNKGKYIFNHASGRIEEPESVWEAILTGVLTLGVVALIVILAIMFQ